MPASDLLESVPSTADRELLGRWMDEKLHRLAVLKVDDEVRASFVSLTASDLGPSDEATLRFANVALIADWACYVSDADRAEVERMHAVVKAFPSGFRVWFVKQGDDWLPVGYTGWYPLSENAFERAYSHPQDIMHRRELWPAPFGTGQNVYIWLFNYSIIAVLRRSDQSRTLLGAYAADIARVSAMGYAAAVISEDSKRVVARFGMTRRGIMTHLGVEEDVYAVRFSKPRPS